jgi:hypothetical protein
VRRRSEEALERIREQIPIAGRIGLRVLKDFAKGTHPDAGLDKATNQLRAATTLVNNMFAVERARQEQTGPRELGVVVIHKRLEDTPENRLEWEAEAKAIEAVVVTKEPDAA